MKLAVLFLCLFVATTTQGQVLYGDSTFFGGNWEQMINKMQTKKRTLVLYCAGQSNMGTDPEWGRVVWDSLPSYYKQNYSNVFFYNQAGSSFNYELAPIILNPFSGTMGGWLNQYIHVMASSANYDNIYMCKRSVGGTTISTVGAGDSYPRSDLYSYATQLKRKMDSVLGVNNHDQLVVMDQCESDALNQTRAENYYTNLKAFRWEFIANTGVKARWVIKRLSSQTKDFTYRTQVQRGQDSLQLMIPDSVSVVNTNNIRHLGFGTRNPVPGNGDFSHYSREGSIAVGNLMAEKSLLMLNKNKREIGRPYLLAATVSTTGDSLVLKYSKPLNTGVKPFWAQFKVGTKCWRAVQVTNDTIILRPTVPFYSGISYTFQYKADSFFIENVQDMVGNRTLSDSNRTITNNCTITQPTVTSLYTSNFATLGSNPADLENFYTGTNGATLTTGITSPSGTTGCVKMQLTAGSNNRFYKWQTTGIVTGSVYRVAFNIEVPDTYSFPGTPTSMYLIASTLGTGSAVSFDFTSLVYRDRLWYIEYQFTNAMALNDDWYFEISSTNSDAVYVKSVTISRVGP